MQARLIVGARPCAQLGKRKKLLLGAVGATVPQAVELALLRLKLGKFAAWTQTWTWREEPHKSGSVGLSSNPSVSANYAVSRSFQRII